VGLLVVEDPELGQGLDATTGGTFREAPMESDFANVAVLTWGKALVEVEVYRGGRVLAGHERISIWYIL